jgi:hypothetical protein
MNALPQIASRISPLIGKLGSPHDGEVLSAARAVAPKLLDMKPAGFNALVKEGHLPPPRNIGGLKRWDVQDLRRIILGEAAEGMGGVTW